ncbi:MAG TPA: YciI family protein [Ktedonobacterales bacterium]|jgi:hypothetical protein|nr:YciI family protein [Ktedonobacterales bacterium]
MTKYLLSAHSVEGEERVPMTDEQLQQAFQQVSNLEADMRSAGAWVFAGRLHDALTATVVRVSNGDVLTTDGPFVESKEHLGGIYIIEAQDLDAALAWAAKVSQAVKAPIEVRPFEFTGEADADAFNRLAQA